MSPITTGINADHLSLMYGATGNKFGTVNKNQIGPWSDSAFIKEPEFRIQPPEISGIGSPAKTEVAGAIKDFIVEVDQKDKVADNMRASILSGESNNLHQTMIASEEASVSFTLMLEMRNKVMETYQELMRLQI